MNTVCPHCQKWFEVSDRALGKNAKCPACAKVFIIAPAPAQSDDDSGTLNLPQPGGSTARMAAVRRDEVDDDPFSALADAAEASGSQRIAAITDQARGHGSSASRRQRGQVGGTASGAVASVVCGSISLALAIVALILVILAAAGVMDKNVGIVMGVLAGGLFTAVLGLIGIVQGGGARKRIRRAKGTLQGSGQATAGIVLGWIAVAVIIAAGVTLLVSLSQSGPIILEQREVQN